MAVWGSELCCACLVRSHPDTMYSLADAETNKLYKECTNIRIFYYEQSRYLCLMCYKQCEIWKCFKTRCQASRALIGRCMEDQQQNPTQSQPASSSQSEDFPENVIIKQEPVDYFMDDEITVGPAYTLNEDPEEDPLEDGEKTVKRKRKRKRQSRKSFGEDFPFNDKSSSCEVTKSSKTKPPIPAPPPLAPVGKLKKEKRESGSLKLKISLSPEKKKVNPGAIQVSCTSIDQYMKTYNDFISWKDRTQPEDREIDEDLLLDFFQSILPIYSGTTMNNKLSHMVNTMGTFHNVDVNKFQRLRDFVRSTREQKSIIMLTPPPQQQPPKKKPKANESLDESGGGGDQLESNGEADSLWTNMF